MKQRIINMLFALTVMAGSAKAQRLSVAPIEAMAGTQAELIVTGTSLSGWTAMQFNLSLPEGITLNEAAITKGAAASDHELIISTLSGGDRLFVLYHMNLFSMKDGELLRLPVIIGKNAASGNALFSTVRFATTEAVSTAVTNVTAAITVKVTKPGDVNGDGKLDLADITDLISIYLSDNYSGSCDLDGDGVLTVEDIAQLINLYLGE